MKPNSLHKLQNNYHLSKTDREELIEYIDGLLEKVNSDDRYKDFCRHHARRQAEYFNQGMLSAQGRGFNQSMLADRWLTGR